MNLDLNKIYYYIICLFAAYTLFWGAIDLVSAGASYISAQTSISMSSERIPDEGTETFYQKKVAQDRLFDSIARIIISGAVFIYCRKKIS